MHKQLWFLSALAIIWCASAPAAAEVDCGAPTTDEWLRQPVYSPHYISIDAPRILVVDRDITTAIGLLRNRSSMALSRYDLQRFMTQTLMPPRPDRGFRPYLVRAVFPTSRPSLEVGWSKKDLHVFAGGLGCLPFAKHPIIVFLERKPANVFVMATAAL